MSSFPCTGCGCCCRRIEQAVKYFNIKESSHPLYFPYKWDKNGVCENLTADNQCKVYENRPLLCNVKEIAKYFNLNEQEFYKTNIRACNTLMETDNIPLQFRISE